MLRRPGGSSKKTTARAEAARRNRSGSEKRACRLLEQTTSPDPIAHRRCNVATHTINRVAIYARISTTNHGQDVSMQLRELREYCERRRWKIGAEYVDVGISGAKERRPRLDELMRHAHRHNFSAVIVWRFDRMALS